MRLAKDCSRKRVVARNQRRCCGFPEVSAATSLSAKMHLPRSGQVPRRAKRGAFAQRKSQEGARYNSVASRDREEPPLIHRSTSLP